MTTANKVTIARILLIPFFVAQVLYYVRSGNEVYRLLAVLCFGICAVTDALDGYIARRYKQKSELGTLLDPLADKLLLVSGVVLLSLDNGQMFERLPLWLVTTVVARDAMLALGWVVIHHACGKVVVRPRVLGKLATVLQMLTVLWVLLKWDARFLDGLTLGAAITTGVSGLLYIWDGIRQLSTSPKSTPIGLAHG
ncbi:MAG: CDP-alcohol phosphatidyltransferase family protein [Verrucomicrobiae bacterium]|nr:CDP-alcohol phosphatidyltransferase family protein [Verrucomicrobiae bacterium]